MEDRAQRIRRKLMVLGKKLNPCLDQRLVEAFEDKHGITLPEAYREFLDRTYRTPSRFPALVRGLVRWNQELVVLTGKGQARLKYRWRGKLCAGSCLSDEWANRRFHDSHWGRGAVSSV